MSRRSKKAKAEDVSNDFVLLCCLVKPFLSCLGIPVDIYHSYSCISWPFRAKKNWSKKSPSTYTWVKNQDQKKLSRGQISIVIVSHVNKHPLLHSTSYDVFSLIDLSSSRQNALRIISLRKAECCRYSPAQFWNKELIFVANKVASPFDESPISSFESLLLSNLVLYPTNLVASLVTKFPGIVARCLSKHFQSFLSFLGVYHVF